MIIIKPYLYFKYPRVTHYLMAFLDLTHGYLAKRGPGPRGPMGPTHGFWSSLTVGRIRKESYTSGIKDLLNGAVGMVTEAEAARSIVENGRR
jgi:hypothetical protein